MKTYRQFQARSAAKLLSIPHSRTINPSKSMRKAAIDGDRFVRPHASQRTSPIPICHGQEMDIWILMTATNRSKMVSASGTGLALNCQMVRAPFFTIAICGMASNGQSRSGWINQGISSRLNNPRQRLCHQPQSGASNAGPEPITALNQN